MRNVVVSGGSRGLGLAIAKTLAAAGFNVIALARTWDANETRSNLHFVSADLTAVTTLHDVARSLQRDFGTIYGLVNNAGIGLSGILSLTPDSQIAEIVQMNILSPMLLTKHLLRSMLLARAGRIINIASIVADTGYPGLAAYSASKAALLGFTRSLAREIGPLGITVNAVAPGFLDTAMTHGLTSRQREQIARRSALHRLATVDDVAATVAYLLSDAACNITGTVLTVDAGNTA